MLSRDQIIAEVEEALEELFEIPPDKITLDAKLYDELGLDSIDAVDLVLHAQGLIGRRVPPEAFKAVRTVGDVVDCIQRLLVTNEGTVG